MGVCKNSPARSLTSHLRPHLHQLSLLHRLRRLRRPRLHLHQDLRPLRGAHHRLGRGRLRRGCYAKERHVRRHREPTFFTLLELLRRGRIVPFFRKAGVAELADALDSKSSGRKAVWVRAPPPATVFIERWALHVGRWMFENVSSFVCSKKN
jgi:hypothetical protein